METVADVAKYQPHLHLPQQRNHYLRWAAGGVQKCRAVQGEIVDFTLPKKVLQTCMAPKLSRFGHSFSAKGVLSSRVKQEWSDRCCGAYIFKDRVKFLTWVVCITGDLHGQLEDLLLIFYKVRFPFHSLHFTCFNKKSQENERKNKPKENFWHFNNNL